MVLKKEKVNNSEHIPVQMLMKKYKKNEDNSLIDTMK